MGFSLRALARRSFGSNRPVDFQTRTAIDLLVGCIESGARSDVLEERAVEVAVAGLDRRDLRLLHVARLLIGALRRRRDEEARMLASAEELLIGAENERELALLERQAQNRAVVP